MFRKLFHDRSKISRPAAFKAFTVVPECWQTKCKAQMTPIMGFGNDVILHHYNRGALPGLVFKAERPPGGCL